MTSPSPSARLGSGASFRGARSAADTERMVRGVARLRRSPLVPELAVWLADPGNDVWGAPGATPDDASLLDAFWAFAWSGGQALARYLLDSPEIAQARRVLDFACGSGLVGIAAAHAGAAEVVCADIDPLATAATRLGATSNGVIVETTTVDLVGSDADGFDVVAAGDVCYESGEAERIVAWLRALAANGVTVLIGDPGRHAFPRTGMEQLATYRLPPGGWLDDDSGRRASVYRVRGDDGT